MATLLVSQESLSTYSPIALNLNQDRLVPHILRAQVDLIPVLGSDLYNDLLDKVAQSQAPVPVPLTPEYLALLDVLAPVLCCRSIYYALPSVWLNITQKSITKESSDNSSTATKSELVYLRDDINSSYNAYQNILVKFLDDHKADYPLYKVATTISAPQSLVCFY